MRKEELKVKRGRGGNGEEIVFRQRYMHMAWSFPFFAYRVISREKGSTKGQGESEKRDK